MKIARFTIDGWASYGQVERDRRCVARQNSVQRRRAAPLRGRAERLRRQQPCVSRRSKASRLGTFAHVVVSDRAPPSLRVSANTAT